MKWHTVCKADDLPLGKMAPTPRATPRWSCTTLLRASLPPSLICTHTFAPLGRGKIIDGCKVQCPLHRARFDIKTGKVIDWANFPPGIQLLNFVRSEKALKTFAVQVKKGEVQVRVD